MVEKMIGTNFMKTSNLILTFLTIIILCGNLLHSQYERLTGLSYFWRVPTTSYHSYKIIYKITFIKTP